MIELDLAGAYEKAQCGGWSTTFDADHCGPLAGPVLDGPLLQRRPELAAGFRAMSSIFGEWCVVQNCSLDRPIHGGSHVCWCP